jgi:hypothetical protein
VRVFFILNLSGGVELQHLLFYFHVIGTKTQAAVPCRGVVRAGNALFLDVCNLGEKKKR